MTEKRHTESIQFLLPFLDLSENRKEPFTKEMEKAAIFSLAELERAKGGGLILKQPEEKLTFVAESCYPLLLIPWGSLNLVLDGLSTVTHTLTYKIIPDAKTFMENVERSSKTLETYKAFLSDNVNYFQIPAKTKEMVINGLITDPNFLDEFISYLDEATQVENPPADTVVLPSTIEESTISSMIQELEKLKSEFKEETSILYESLKFLNQITHNFIKIIRTKIKAIREEIDKEIKKQEAIITPKVDHINEEYDEKITKLAKDFEKQLLPIQKEKVKLEKNKEQILNEIERCKIEAKTCAVNKDEVGERRWKEKADQKKKELSEIEAKIKEYAQKIKEIEESKSLETFRLRSEWEAKVNEAKKELLELEASRDAKIQLHTQEIEKLERLSSTITEQIGNVAKMREVDLAGLEKLGITQRQKRIALVYVLFYLVCYQSESKRRYVLFPPSVANSVSFLAKLKGALGKARVKQIITRRFETITSYLNKFPASIDQNSVLEREINEAVVDADILKKETGREQILNGLKRLKEEGWLSEKEYEVFSQKLV